MCYWSSGQAILCIFVYVGGASFWESQSLFFLFFFPELLEFIKVVREIEKSVTAGRFSGAGVAVRDDHDVCLCIPSCIRLCSSGSDGFCYFL